MDNFDESEISLLTDSSQFLRELRFVFEYIHFKQFSLFDLVNCVAFLYRNIIW